MTLPGNLGKRGIEMHIYAQIGEFAASAGALEGFVYRRDDLDQETLRPWVTNLSESVTGFCRMKPGWKYNRPWTAASGRDPAIPGNRGQPPNSDVIWLLTGLLVNDRAGSPDDFQKTKWFQK